MEISRLNQRVTFRQKTRNQDANGQVIWTFSNYKTVWAEVETTGGSEVTEAQEKTGVFTINVTIRTGITIDVTMRILWMGEEYNITSINQIDLTIGRQKAYVISAKAKGDD